MQDGLALGGEQEPDRGGQVSGKALFPRRKVAVCDPRAAGPPRMVSREGLQNEARLESYWLGSRAIKVGATLSNRAPCPKGDPQEQTSGEKAAAALCVWRRGFCGIPSHSSYSV